MTKDKKPEQQAAEDFKEYVRLTTRLEHLKEMQARYERTYAKKIQECKGEIKAAVAKLKVWGIDAKDPDDGKGDPTTPPAE